MLEIITDVMYNYGLSVRNYNTYCIIILWLVEITAGTMYNYGLAVRKYQRYIVEL